MSEMWDGVMPLDFESLRTAFGTRACSPSALIETIYDRIDDEATAGIWIHRVARARALEAARAVEARDASKLPLNGVPFAVKDNIDVEGLPTTAGCPAFAYVAKRTAPVVARLLDAGAVLVGKTNLDQFATGLVGTRSPYGVPPNPFDPRYITGGSSSGSAAAVSRGLVSFALGTDTAGSGRVPAAFTNIVGLKPSRGLLSTTGVVPACRSIDCVSIFALTCEDARRAAEVATAFDRSDPYSRPDADGYSWHAPARPVSFCFAMPREEDLFPYVDTPTLRGFEVARAHLEALGGHARAIDLGPFFEAGRLLYDGPWIAERLEGLESFLSSNADSLLSITRQILEGGRRFRATELFAALHQLQKLNGQVRSLFHGIEALLLPAAPNHPRIDEVAQDPLGCNGKLGLYANFVNLLDLAAISVPTESSHGLPLGVTLVGPGGSDAKLVALGSALHARTSQTIGATNWRLPESKASNPLSAVSSLSEHVRVAVVGAHLSGQPLNHQLKDRRAHLVRTARTAPRYRLFVLPATPPKPGLVRMPEGEHGFAIETEVWMLPRAELGTFFAQVVPPLCLGTVELDDGDAVAGFLCEGCATVGARDISHLGGWRKYLESTGQ